jgi:hypothetical protein
MADIDEDGYEIVPDQKINTATPSRGRKCGRCGMKFEHNAGYGFRCPYGDCPCGWG